MTSLGLGIAVSRRRWWAGICTTPGRRRASRSHLVTTELLCGTGTFCGCFAASSSQVLGGEVPVRQLPEGLDVLGPRVAAVDVVGVLPDIAGQQGLVLGRQRGAGVGGRPQFESSVRHLDEPSPAGAEEADGGFGELFLELLEGPEVLLDALEQRAGRFARGIRAEAAPVEGVVPDLGGVVEDLPSEERTMSSSGRFSYLVPGMSWFRLFT